MDKIEELLTRGTDTIYPSRKALETALRSGKKLTLYQGFDPTGTELHIGHMTGLMKLRQFQNLGHKVIFLIGDGTGQAGDPSGKSKTRDTFFTKDELRQNAKDYVMQASKIVDFEGDNPVTIMYNSTWLNKLGLVELLDIAGNFSLQQLEERDMFQERKKKGETVNMREFLYPLLQGYDSVAMNVDLEVGGSDQTFNMLCGRTLVKSYLNKEKFVLTTPLLTDKAGRKIGKTEGNVIALNSKPTELFGMIMSLGDDVIIKAFEYLTTVSMETVNQYEQRIKNGENPMKYKKLLANEIVSMLNTDKEAKHAQDYFEKTVQEGSVPENIPTYTPQKNEAALSDLLVQAGLASSKSEAKRLITQGGVEINGAKKNDPSLSITLKNGDILKAGKRNFVKIVL